MPRGAWPSKHALGHTRYRRASHEFVTLCLAASVSMTELCRRFQISRKAGYKWCRRFSAGGAAALVDQTRQRQRVSHQTGEHIEAMILALRREQPTWGPRKLHRKLLDLGNSPQTLPAVSTFARILRRNGYITAHTSDQHQRWKQFSRSKPNEAVANEL